jgi:SSS family solute:Na+ symporter
METLDYIVIAVYAVAIVSLALYISNRGGKEKTSKDYFLAGNTLTWWAIGTSLIASNISAEQVIGMTGSGYAMGLAIASYEFMAAITLIVIAKWLLPIYLEKKIYTMPQFLELRYDGRVRTILAVFWLLVYVFVNLTSIMYLGAQALEAVVGTELLTGVLILAGFSAIYSLYGGLMAVAWTDVVQVTVLILGGVVTTWIALDLVGGGNGPIEGLSTLVDKAPDKFEMLFEGTDTFTEADGTEKNAYQLLPWFGVLFGGMWIANLFYWGFNQYITQRALAAKSLDEAQRGMMFAGYLKLFMPLIVVVPGIAAYVLMKENTPEQLQAMVGASEPIANSIGKSDAAYPWLLKNLVPTGIKGLAFAALAAAIVSSLSSMINSISTIFTIDIYQKRINPDASEKRLVSIGRLVAGIALVIAIPIVPLLGNLDQVFQFIQEFTGFVSPGVLAIFLVGMFWKKATANSAIIAAILSIPLGYAFKSLTPNLPFLDRMGIIFLILAAVMIVFSLIEGKGQEDPKALSLRKGIFHTSNTFNIGAIGIAAALAVVYLLLANPPV